MRSEFICGRIQDPLDGNRQQHQNKFIRLPLALFQNAFKCTLDVLIGTVDIKLIVPFVLHQFRFKFQPVVSPHLN